MFDFFLIALLMSPINKKSNLLNVLRVEKDIEEEEIVEELKKEEESPKKKITRHHPTRSIY